MIIVTTITKVDGFTEDELSLLTTQSARKVLVDIVTYLQENETYHDMHKSLAHSTAMVTEEISHTKRRINVEKQAGRPTTDYTKSLLQLTKEQKSLYKQIYSLTTPDSGPSTASKTKKDVKKWELDGFTTT